MQFIANAHLFVRADDIAVARFFESFKGKAATGFKNAGLYFPQSIAFYRLMGALAVWTGEHGPIMALIAYPVAEPTFGEATSLPEPFWDAPYIYGHALAAVDSIKGQVVERFTDYFRKRFPLATHYYGWRGDRLMRPIRIRPCRNH